MTTPFGGMHGMSGAGRIDITLAAMKEVKEDQLVEKLAAQVDTARDLKTIFTEARFSFPKLAKTRKTLKEQKGRVQKMKFAAEKGERLPREQTRQKAEEFERRNPELKARALQALREQIKSGDDAESLLVKVREYYEDPSLADEALEFLLDTTEGSLHQEVAKAREGFNKTFGREIAAGRNIGTLARQASDKGLGAPTTLRDLYRDITGNPRDSNTLFEELSQRYAFKDLRKVVGFLLHSLGADMKAKGPSIPRGQLHRLLTETRSLQAILGVYRFFQGRMRLVRSLFHKEGLKIPQKLTFEAMAKEFMALARERYPSGDKVLGSARRLGIEEWILAKIIVFSQLRDAIREVAMQQIYRSPEHRDEMFTAILEALEDLEDELEELLERGEGEEEGEKGESEQEVP